MSTKPNTSKSATSTEAKKSETNEVCIAEGCKHKAVSHPEWDNEYCSIKCCYDHCKTTFKAWLEANKAAQKSKSCPGSSNQVPGPSNQPTETANV